MKRRDMVATGASLIGFGLVGGSVIAGPSTSKPSVKPPAQSIVVVSLLSGAGRFWRLSNQNAPVIGKPMVMRVHSVKAAPNMQFLADSIFNADQLGQTTCAMATARAYNTSSDYCFNVFSEVLNEVKITIKDGVSKTTWNANCLLNSKQSARITTGEYRLVAHFDNTPAFLIEQACQVTTNSALPTGVLGVIGLTSSLA